MLGTDHLDVFQLFWLNTMSAWTPAVVEELVKLSAEGAACSGRSDVDA